MCTLSFNRTNTHTHIHKSSVDRAIPFGGCGLPVAVNRGQCYLTRTIQDTKLLSLLPCTHWTAVVEGVRRREMDPESPHLSLSVSCCCCCCLKRRASLQRSTREGKATRDDNTDGQRQRKLCAGGDGSTRYRIQPTTNNHAIPCCCCSLLNI